MNGYIDDLLEKMSDDNYLEGEVKINGVYESGKTISSKAFDEARTLSNTEYLDELYFKIHQEKDLAIRSNLYFIVKHIGINTQNIEATSFLINRLAIEKDKNLLVNILLDLGELYKPSVIDISPIIKCIENKNWHVRGKAYEALTNSEYDVEELLLRKLKNNSNIDDIWYIVVALQYVATEKSKTAIEQFLKSRKSSVKNAACFAFAILLLRQGNSFEDVSKKVNISIETLINLKEKLPIFTRRPLKLM